MITPQQSKAARALLKWNMHTLGKAAGLQIARISDFEIRNRILEHDMQKIITAFNTAGIRFTKTGVDLPERS